MKKLLFSATVLGFFSGALVASIALDRQHTKEIEALSNREQERLETYVEMISFQSCISGSLRTLEILAGLEVKTPKCEAITEEWMQIIRKK